MKISFISPYEELGTLVSIISKQMDVQVDVYEGVLEKGVEILRRLEHEKYDIIISRGATYWSIAKQASIPVLNCEVTSFDILYAVNEAKKISNKIGLINYKPVAFNEQLITEIFKIDLLYMTSYTSSNQLRKMVEEAVQKGAEVIIGGILTQQYAQELGCCGILLKTSEETIRQTITKAVEIVSLTKSQLLEAERLKHIINFSYDGIIATDEKGLVTIFNPAAEQILGIKASDIMNKKADEHILIRRMFDGETMRQSKIGCLQKLRNTTIITNKIPIKIKDDVQGAIATFQDIGKIQDWEAKIRSELYQKGLVAKYTFNDYIGSNEVIRKLIAKARRYSESDSTVLITGESGTGKEILAQGIHNSSKRKGYPFVAVNCSAIPENLLESELFGYEGGAFTGAKKGGKMGLFELAHKGTIFLDEIGSIPRTLQAKLLRVLQEREVWRVGSTKVVQIDVRVIAATNSNLLEAVESGSFRRDLYYRLNILNLQTIPLRERKEDIKELLNYFFKLYGRNRHLTIDKEIEKLLREYYWPGNVRELQNFVERLILLQNEVAVKELVLDFTDKKDKELDSGTFEENRDEITIAIGGLRDMEKAIIVDLYKRFNGNVTMLAQKLGISRTTIWKKLKKK